MKKYLCVFVGLALFLPMAAGAAQFQGSQIVGFNETVKDNVYVSGGTVNIAGTIDGDLYVVGGTVSVLGTVTKDVTVIGGTVIITGKIGDDLRVLGGNVTVGGAVGGEVAAGSGSINVLSSAAIGGGAYLAGGSVIMSGSVGKDLVLAAGEISLGSGLKVGGDFDYYSEKEATIDSSVKIKGETNFHQQVIKKNSHVRVAPTFGMLAWFTIWGIIWILSGAIITSILFYFWRKDSEEIIESVFANPGKELLRGFVVLFIMPIAALVFCLTVIGLPIGVLLGFSFAVLGILGAAATGLLWAAILAKFVFRRGATAINWWMIILAVFLLAIIKCIPFMGWLIGFVVFLAGFGAMSNLIYKKIAPRK